jgi:hypothetical protein
MLTDWFSALWQGASTLILVSVVVSGIVLLMAVCGGVWARWVHIRDGWRLGQQNWQQRQIERREPHFDDVVTRLAQLQLRANRCAGPARIVRLPRRVH